MTSNYPRKINYSFLNLEKLLKFPKDKTLKYKNMTTTKNKILIVGSKPNFTIPKLNYDKAYFANAAISRSELINTKKRTSIISAYLEEPKTELTILAKYQIDNADFDEKIVLGKLYEKTKFKNSYFISWHNISFSVIKLIGLKEYISLITRNNNITTIINEIKNLLLKGYVECLKPSTGIAAVLYALNNEKEPEIDVIGIGLSNDGYSYTNINNGRGHINSDKIIIKHLLKKKVKFYDLDQND